MLSEHVGIHANFLGHNFVKSLVVLLRNAFVKFFIVFHVELLDLLGHVAYQNVA